jgi:transposase
MLSGMTDSTDDLPDDIERLKALLRAERGEKARLADQNERLLHILRQLRRNHFGRKSERLSEEQLNLGLEDLETAIASGEAAAEKADATLRASRKAARKVNRGHLPAHLPREEIVIEPPSTACPCCGGDLHVIGEDRSERLDKVPAKYRVIVTRRPKYACRTCEKTGAGDTAGIIQAPAPARLIEGGLPTEALVADVVVQKYAWHQPLYRQSQQMATDGIEIDRSTLAHWVGFAAFELMLMPSSRASDSSLAFSPSIEMQPETWKPPMQTRTPAARSGRAISTARGYWLVCTPTNITKTRTSIVLERAIIASTSTRAFISSIGVNRQTMLSPRHRRRNASSTKAATLASELEGMRERTHWMG